MVRPDLWTPEQAERRTNLLQLLPERPWWIVVAPPKRPKACTCTPWHIMRWDHTSWRSALPPCGDECLCVAWALTPADARRIAKLQEKARAGLP